MRLKKSFIEHIAKQIVRELIAGDHLTVASSARLEAVVREAIVCDLAKEDELNEEALDIIEAQLAALPERERNNIDMDEMFRLVKKQLAKERKMIL